MPDLFDAYGLQVGAIIEGWQTDAIIEDFANTSEPAVAGWVSDPPGTHPEIEYLGPDAPYVAFAFRDRGSLGPVVVEAFQIGPPLGVGFCKAGCSCETPERWI
jgi:hypothetical protein